MSTAGLFGRLAARYDAWYEGPAGAAVFAAEVACLRPLLAGLPRPWAEIGAGSGRFAAALGVDVGLDPAAAPLLLARSRGIRVIQGVGERLPFRPGVFGAVLIVVTVCFADDPAALLTEARRVTRGDGAVILGEVFAGSPWGRFYQRQGTAGHPFYSAARFLPRAQALALTAGAGLQLQAARSVLYQPPSGTPRPERVTVNPDQPDSCAGAPSPPQVPGRCRRPGKAGPGARLLAAAPAAAKDPACPGDGRDPSSGRSLPLPACDTSARIPTAAGRRQPGRAPGPATAPPPGLPERPGGVRAGAGGYQDHAVGLQHRRIDCLHHP